MAAAADPLPSSPPPAPPGETTPLLPSQPSALIFIPISLNHPPSGFEGERLLLREPLRRQLPAVSSMQRQAWTCTATRRPQAGSPLPPGRDSIPRLGMPLRPSSPCRQNSHPCDVRERPGPAGNPSQRVMHFAEKWKLRGFFAPPPPGDFAARQSRRGCPGLLLQAVSLPAAQLVDVEWLARGGMRDAQPRHLRSARGSRYRQGWDMSPLPPGAQRGSSTLRQPGDWAGCGPGGPWLSPDIGNLWQRLSTWGWGRSATAGPGTEPFLSLPAFLLGERKPCGTEENFGVQGAGLGCMEGALCVCVPMSAAVCGGEEGEELAWEPEVC